MTKDQAYLKAYKNAVWAFMLEHCDILPSGKMFIKFHTDGQANFEKRVNARFLYDYHREDHVTKEKIAIEKREEFVTTKEEKRKRWEADKKERRAKQNIIKREVLMLDKINKMSPFRRWIYNTFKI